MKQLLEAIVQKVRRKSRRILRSDRFYEGAMRLFGILPLQRKVVFSSYDGAYFNDSPLEIFREMRSQGLDCRYVWFSKRGDDAIEGARTVPFFSLRACYHLATARIWVDNKRKPLWVRKRKGQFYVQTWHSGLTNKSGEGDEEQKLDPAYVRRAKHDSEMVDLFVSGSKWQTAHYRRAFWYDGEILESGLPRSDGLFQPSGPARAKVCERLGIGPEEKLVLYAPTFRNSHSLDVYDLDCHRMLDALRARFGGEWKCLVRLHPNIAKLHGAYTYDADVLDASDYSDINELILASEWVISDYSSCMFDALEAGKRVALYASDVAEYVNERGFYFTFEELPFHLSETNDDLIDFLMRFDADEYRERGARFLERCGVLDDGNAAGRVVEYLVKKIDPGR